MTRRVVHKRVVHKRVVHRAQHGEHAVQLRLLPGRRSQDEWVLDERTRDLGRRGVAQAKEILRRVRPPDPATERRAS
jgi:hypothetical protein